MHPAAVVAPVTARQEPICSPSSHAAATIVTGVTVTHAQKTRAASSMYSHLCASVNWAQNASGSSIGPAVALVDPEVPLPGAPSSAGHAARNTTAHTLIADPRTPRP